MSTDLRVAPPGAKAITRTVTFTHGELETIRNAVERLFNPLGQHDPVDRTTLLRVERKLHDTAERRT